MGQLVNERFSPTPTVNYLQSGWVIAGPNVCPSGCSGDQVPINSKKLVWGDSSVSPFNNNAHVFGYPNQVPAWVSGQTMTAEILCNGGSFYKEQMVYGSSLLAHTSAVTCTTKAYGNEITNSVFLENGNTGASNAWSSDITSTVQAKNASEKLNGVWTGWQSAADEDQPCSGPPINPSASMTGFLNGGTVTWNQLNNVIPGC